MDLQEFMMLENPATYDLKQEIMTFKTEDVIDRYLGYQAVDIVREGSYYEEDRVAAKTAKERAVVDNNKCRPIPGGEADNCLLFRDIWEKLWSDPKDQKGSERLRLCSSGDTMNSAHTTIFNWCQLNGKDVGNSNSKRRVIRECILSDKKLLEPATDFLNACYTIGNLIPVPSNDCFNRARVSKTRDYWDLTLRGIYQWYTEGKKDEALESIISETGTKKNPHTMKQNIEEVKKWMETFVDWNDFVKKNFMNPFVEKKEDGTFGEPRELWDGHFNGAVLPQSEQDCKDFFKNASTWIQERSELIYDELKKRQEKEEK